MKTRMSRHWALFLLLLLGLGGLLAALALQREPSLPAASGGGGERLAVHARLLWGQLRPGAAPAGVLRSTVFQQRDLNALLEQASQAQGDAWRAHVSLEQDGATLLASRRWGERLWLNLRLSWDLKPGQAGAWPRLNGARLGRLPIPAWLAGWAVGRAAQRHPQGHWLNALPLLRPMVERWQARPGYVLLHWRWQPEQMSKVLALLLPAAERQALLAQRAVLREQLLPMPPGGPVNLLQLWQPMAQQGLQRVAQGGDPAVELRALFTNLALHAMGRDLGQWLVDAREQGPLTPTRVLLDGRDDMAMHLLLSALLAWEGGERASAAMGLAKELADRRVGSGFSFNDLAADEAGSRLGLLAERAPQRLLARMAAGMAQAEFFPEIGDLPEFLSDPEFRQRYERVGSPAYEAEMQRIHARVAALPLYQANSGKP